MVKKKPLRKPGNFIRDTIPKEGHFIAYKMFKSDEFHGNDPMAELNVLIKYRNPMSLIGKIQEQFTKQEFRAPLNITYSVKDKIPGTVNSYVLVNFKTSRVPKKLDWSWTNMPVVEDPNLYPNYKKNYSVEDYVEDLMNQ
jgi:hypothetical protein